MKLITPLGLVALALLPVGADAEPVRISDQNAPFVYEVKAEIPTPKESLAKMISADYRRAPDEFTAHELFEKIAPVVDKRIAESKATKEWSVVIGAQLAQYDFGKKGFPTGFTETTFIPYDNGYALMFSNAASFGLLPVEMANAKRLSGQLQRNRSCSVIVEGTVVGAKEEDLNYSSRKVIVFEISRLTIKLQDGTEVGVVTK
jgi:hypothetical protein